MNNEEVTVAMKTPVKINDVDIQAIVDTGAASSAISGTFLKEIGEKITESSKIRCVMANGDRTASLGKTTVMLEIQDIITPVEVEVIQSPDRSLLLGNNVLSIWNSNIDYSTKIMNWKNGEISMDIPIEYVKTRRVKFEETIEEIEDDDWSSEEDESSGEEIPEIMTLQEEEYSSEDELN